MTSMTFGLWTLAVAGLKEQISVETVYDKHLILIGKDRSKDSSPFRSNK